MGGLAQVVHLFIIQIPHNEVEAKNSNWYFEILHLMLSHVCQII